MPVRSLTQSLLRWPEPEQELHQVRLWAVQVAAEHPGLERVALFGSYGQILKPTAQAELLAQGLSQGHRPATRQPLCVSQVVISRLAQHASRDEEPHQAVRPRRVGCRRE